MTIPGFTQVAASGIILFFLNQPSILYKKSTRPSLEKENRASKTSAGMKSGIREKGQLWAEELA